MKVTIKYFAAIREAIGQGIEVRETLAVNLSALRDELLAASPAHADSLARGRSVRMALNQVMSDESATLTEGCEVAFFPPVTGG
ncbi:MAG: molybdopterin synthase sulfur carrier subunit [Burkholderiales bacterium RIFCSPHIGHO2_12_FULL_61_11]|nr:MAG: molybdopterin synthase sulfur carrier subunit [Burkholderiales bacterium RIFCSPHIGHO2_12_FULL_61_11]